MRCCACDAHADANADALHEGAVALGALRKGRGSGPGLGAARAVAGPRCEARRGHLLRDRSEARGGASEEATNRIILRVSRILFELRQLS